jgi:hypothetical protein
VFIEQNAVFIEKIAVYFFEKIAVLYWPNCCTFIEQISVVIEQIAEF